MKRRRIIKLKDSRLRNARTQLRILLRLEKQKKISGFYGDIKAIDLDNSLSLEEKIKKQNTIRNKIASLESTYNLSILLCSVCKKQDKDLIYIPRDSSWYCEDCYRFNQEYYKKYPEEDMLWRDLHSQS